MSESTSNDSGFNPVYVPKYLRVSAVKALIRENDRRAGADFLELLDRMVERKVRAACKTHNGSKKTLDVTVAGYVGITNQSGERR